MGDHTETLEIDFDPNILSYEELLNVFWGSHNPLREPFYKGRQYISLLLHHDEEQKEKVYKLKKQWEKKLNGEIQTEIAPYKVFYPAEEYHQKYYLKRYKHAVNILSDLFPEAEQFRDSTIVARLNGFVKGYGTMACLKIEINEWGLAPEQEQLLLNCLDKIKW